jgi:CIC family chloride channel protein
MEDPLRTKLNVTVMHNIAQWLFSKLSNRQFLVTGAIVVGLWAGLTAVVLKVSVHYLQESLKNFGALHPWAFVLSPPLGILATYLFATLVLKGDLVKGTEHVLVAIAKKSSFLPRKEVYSHFVTSALTVGLGGSAGLESPIVQTGSAIGSTFSSFFPIGYRDRTLLLACGAAAGIATAFNAPIAGVLFALEVLLVDINIAAFIPLLIAGATGALCSKIILSEGILLSFHEIKDFNYRNIPFYALLGIACGLTSAFYLKAFHWSENVFTGIFKKKYARLAAGCLMLGLLILVFPPLFGEGYSTIKSLASSEPADIFLGSPFREYLTGPLMLGVGVAIICLIKVFAVSLTLNAGGNGGNFAPSLLVGACLGFSFAYLGNLSGTVSLPISNFCVVAMAGVLAGIFHCPLTAIFLIAELTGGYELIIPLMLVSALSTATAKYINPHSLDQGKLFRSAARIAFGRDTHILSDLNITTFIEKDFHVVNAGATLRDLTQAVIRSKRNIFPVVNHEGDLTGIVFLEEIREIMFDHSQYDTITVDKLMRKPTIIASTGDDMLSVMEKFDKTGVWNIPVVDSGKYIGFISKSRIFSNYRDRLKVE